MITIREFKEFDYPDCVEIYNSIFTDYTGSVAELKHSDQRFDQVTYRMERLIAIDSYDKILGFGQYYNRPSEFHPNKFWIDIMVRPNSQRRGIGTFMLDAILERVEVFHPLVIRSRSREDLPSGIRFLNKEGFHEIGRNWEIVLDVQFAKTEQTEPILRNKFLRPQRSLPKVFQPWRDLADAYTLPEVDFFHPRPRDHQV